MVNVSFGRRPHLRGVAAALLAGTALAAAAWPALAQDATWLLNPGSNDFNTAANWDPATVPSFGTGFFDVSNTTALSVSGSSTIVSGFTFNAGASNYTFSIVDGLAFRSAGIVINGGSATFINDGVLNFFATSTAGGATINNSSGGFVIFNSNSTAGNASITNSGSLSFNDASSAGSANITGAMTFNDTSTAASASITTSNLDFNDSSSAGGATITNSSGFIRFANTSTAASATITNNFALIFFESSTAGSATITNNSTFFFAGSSTAGNAAITNNANLSFSDSATAGSATITTGGDTLFFNTSTGGNAQFITNVGGTFDMSGLTAAGMTAGSIEGQGSYLLGAKALTVGSNNLSTEVSGVISGSGGALIKTGAGTLTLSGINTYTGATTVDAGTLVVNSSIAMSSSTTVNSGGTLGGTGLVGATTINTGGTFAPGSGTPGTTTTVQGNLAFQSGAIYLVQVNPAAASSANVTAGGSATLGGVVNAAFAGGSYVARSYNILSATGGFGGSTFDTLATTNLPAGFIAGLSYTSNDVMLNLLATLGVGGGLNQNQQNVANALNNSFNGGGVLTPGFVTVFGLTGPALGSALTQLSGEHATGIQPASNLSTAMFLNAMLDPFVIGRTGGFGTAMGYGAEPVPSRTQVAAQDAFAAALPAKAPPLVPSTEQRWSVWGSAYGGRNRIDGDAVVGSNDLKATVGGFAAGADYRVSATSVIGAAVAIGETRWNVSGLGNGNADVAQVGGYAASRWEALYVSGAVALGWHRAVTDRTVTIAGTDRLQADFNATSFGGRIEGGYRFGGMALGLTPYAAVQVQGIHTPSYGEVATSGSNQFALRYNAQSPNDIRTELGAWLDARHAFADSSQLVLRGRAAWVHDYEPGSRVKAAFQTLPGADFTVDGAAAPSDAVLTSAVAELRFINGVSLIGKFDGAFSDRSLTLAGTGTFRYSW